MWKHGGDVQMDECILIIDDEQSIQEFLTLALEDEGYMVQTASNGLEALDKVAQHHTCLILLDMQMPVMDGWEFLEQYCEVTKHAPIIAFSASPHKVDTFSCASEFIAKPFNLDQLLGAVAKYVVPRP
jgi:two-component system, OmpR family, response regulator